MSAESRHVTVEIYDQTYHLRGQDPEYIQKLADLVDQKMRAVASHGATVDSLRVAVLAALNVADELLTLEERHSALNGRVEATETAMRTRAHSLNGLLEEVLSDPAGHDARRTG
ncbi:MAG TPA: cell division protein ZapA [Acidobacteriaceae bacterium]